jgi:hypothetical protein
MRNEMKKSRWFVFLLAPAGLILSSLACNSIMPPTPTPTPTSTPTSTNTPTPTNTPTVTPTFTPSLTPTLSYLEWPVVITETFDDNSNEWFVGKSNDKYVNSIVAITDGQYLVDVTALQGVFWWLSPTMKNLTDFYATVEVNNLTGPATADYGLAFRISSGNKYSFGIAAADQVYGFAMSNNGEWTTIIKWTSSSLINASGSNQIGVLAEGASFSFFINGELVDQVDDATLKMGKVGIQLELADAGDKAQIAFDNFAVQAP